MPHSYTYVEATDSRAESSERSWGRELTPEQAAKLFTLDSAASDNTFNVVLLEDDAEHPSSCLEISPGGHHIVLHRLNEHGSVTAAYEWKLSDDDDDAVFLSELTWFAYPCGERFYKECQAVGSVAMQFEPDGRALRRRVSEYAVSPESVETSEYSNVDVSSNWARIPEFGDWDEFFAPVAA